MRWDGPGYSALYRSVRKSELMRVDLPSPDSPEKEERKKKLVLGKKSMSSLGMNGKQNNFW